MIGRRLAAVVLALPLAAVFGPARAGEPITMSNIDAIRAHVAKFWVLPEGTRNSGNVIELQVETRPDGTVTGVTILTPSPPGAVWTQVALSARRAVSLASPLPLPAGKHDQFKNFVLVFNTKT